MRRLDWVVDRWSLPLDLVMDNDAAWLDNGWLFALACLAVFPAQILWADLIFFGIIGATVLDWVWPL